MIETGLAGLVGGGHFFDLLAEDVVFEFIITVPDYPRRIAGRGVQISHFGAVQVRPGVSAFWWRSCLAVPGTRLAAGLGA